MLRLVSILCMTMLCTFTSFATIWLPAIFGNQMVLQQNSTVKIWGTATAGKKLVINPSWSKQTVQVIPDASGAWSATLQTLPADHIPHTLTLKQGKSRREITDILLGEVWLCTGQSNMEMKMKGYYGKPIIGAPRAIANATNSKLRLFEVAKAFDCVELPDCKGAWQQATPQSVANFSAAAYFFGKQLQQTLQVPVALIMAPWGGSPIQAFMSREALAPFSECKIPQTKGEIKSPNGTPTVLYNAMIHPIEGFGMRGCIWYQGESNRNEPARYKELYSAMLTDWRAKWGIGDFPVIYAQVAPFDYADGNSAFIREAQAECAQLVANTQMISLLDVGEEHDIHPSDKETVGFRYAAAALDQTYGVEGIASEGPTYKAMKVSNGKAILTFDHAASGFTTYGRPLYQFQIAGADRVFHPAIAHASKSSGVITVHSAAVANPVAVRYGFTDYVQGTLYNNQGVPASSFRTDRW